jgi:hypothetical protein
VDEDQAVMNADGEFIGSVGFMVQPIVRGVVTTLGVYKPWGLTRYGRRKQQERRKIQQQPVKETPLGVKIFFAMIGVLVLVFVILHLTAHGFESHGH